MEQTADPMGSAGADQSQEQAARGTGSRRGRPVHYEVAKKEASMYLRLPESLLQAIKSKAAELGIPYTRYVRMALEDDLRRR